MRRLKSVLILLAVGLLTSLLMGCQLPGGKPSGAKDGYFTWVDEQGRVRQSPIPQSQQSSEEDIMSAASSGSAEADGASTQSREKTSSQASSWHEEFNLDNYPDGDALAERGFVREGDPEPYFTWRDAQGNVRVSYYRPDTRTAVEKGDIKPPIQLTPASIHQPSPVPTDTRLPEGADPLAAAVLGLDSNEATFFDRWSNQCCGALDRSDVVSWEMGREFGVDVTDQSSRHDFVSGQSRYRLVSLPLALNQKSEAESLDRPVSQDFILRLRSFDQKGLFVPSVAFLDENFQPLRIVSDLDAEFFPESWAHHGYLRAHIPVFPSRGERWMLIYTTDKDRQQRTVIETRFGPRTITHQPTGEMGIERVEQ